MKENKPENNHLTALIRNSGFNFIGRAIPLFVGLIAIPLSIKGLGMERFGLLSLVWAALAYMSLSDMGLGRATTKFVAEAIGKKEEQKIPALIWTSIIIQFGLGVAGGGLLAVLTPFLIHQVFHVPPPLIPEMRMALYLTSASIPVFIVSGGLTGIMEGFQRYDVINAVKIVSQALMLFIPALSLPFRLNLADIFLLFFLHSIAFTIVNLLLCFKFFPCIREKGKVNLHLFKILFLYGGWLTVAYALWPFTLLIDRSIIGALISSDAVGYYTAPYEMITRLSIIPTSFVTLFPFFSSLGEQRRKDALDVFLRTSKHLMLLMGPVVIGVTMFAGQILEMWLGMDFRYNSAGVLQILTIGVFMGALVCPSDMLLKAHRPDWVAKLLLILFLFFIGPMYFLTKKYGIVGTATAWTLRSLITTAIAFLLSSRLIPLNRSNLQEGGLKRSMIWFITFGLIIFGVKLLWKETITSFVLTCMLTAIFGFVAWRFVLDETDRQSFIGAIPRFFKRKTLMTKKQNSLNIN